MACKLVIQCDLVFGFVKCAIHEDTIDADLKAHALKDIHTFKKDYKSKTSKWSQWGTDMQPYLD